MMTPKFMKFDIVGELTLMCRKIRGKTYGVVECDVSFGGGNPVPAMAVIVDDDRWISTNHSCRAWLRDRGLSPEEVDDLIASARRAAKMTTVRVYTRGGVIQDMDVPEGVRVEVYDGDITGLTGDDQENLVTDKYGEQCVYGEWTNSGQ